jgi:hypothetical protein
MSSATTVTSHAIRSTLTGTVSPIARTRLRRNARANAAQGTDGVSAAAASVPRATSKERRRSM